MWLWYNTTFFETNKSFLKHNRDSSTRHFSLKIKEIPWCFQTGVDVYSNVEWVWAAQRSSWPKKLQHIELKAKVQTLSGNAVFFRTCSLAFIAQREISAYSLLNCMPVLHSQQTMLWRNEFFQISAVFLTTHPLQPKKLLSFTNWWLLLS